MNKPAQPTEENQSPPVLRPLTDGKLVLSQDPFEALQNWLDDAKSEGALEPTAMTLATASREGIPSARIVLLKGISQNEQGVFGVEFYTNYESKKSIELIENPFAALVFHWNSLRRQVRLEGTVVKVSREQSQRYFKSRARDSQIGAWSSAQSKYLKSRDELLANVELTKKRFGSGEIDCPPFWGGWLLMPNRFEFWEERANRLHERYEMKLEAGIWTKRQLSP